MTEPQFDDLPVTIKCLDIKQDGRGLWEIHHEGECIGVFLHQAFSDVCEPIAHGGILRRHMDTYDTIEEFWTVVLHSIEETLQVHPDRVEIDCTL